MPDYADWTESIELLGTEIQVPIDIQGAFIQMPIDIQGQYVTLDINIESVAADVTMNVNITASAVTINMDIKAQSVAIKSQGEWSPQAGQQKYFRVSGSSVAVGGSAAADYTVTAGKTLFITHFGGSMYGTAAADRDKDQVCYMNIMNNTTAIILAELGGHGGGGMVLPTPVKIPAGEVFRYQIWNFSNHVCEVYLTAGGYEI